MQDLRLLADFMTEFWKLIKETVNEEQTDEYWQNLMERAAQLGRTKLEQKLLMTYLDYLDNDRH